MMKSEGRVGVLCGGPSAEREISIRSGKAIHEALLSQGFSVLLVELSANGERIPDEIKRADLDYAFIALHGPFGEDGTIQEILEELKIPYTGSWVEASRYAMDKASCRLRWLAAKLPVPKSILVEPINALVRSRELPFPLVVKPVAQGSSYGMSIVDEPEELSKAVQEAARYGEQILLEEYLPGPELTVGILGDQPLPVIQVIPKRRFYDVIAKYTPGMTEYLVPAPLPSEITQRAQELAKAAHNTLGCRSFSRVDMILVPQRGLVLLEINTIPGMTATSLLPKAAKAAGIDFSELCRQMLSSAFHSPAPVGANP